MLGLQLKLFRFRIINYRHKRSLHYRNKIIVIAFAVHNAKEFGDKGVVAKTIFRLYRSAIVCQGSGTGIDVQMKNFLKKEKSYRLREEERGRKIFG